MESVNIGSQPRGQNFTAKFKKGEWAESILLDLFSRHPEFYPIKYGVSRGEALTHESDLDEFKEPQNSTMKRPDILVFEQRTIDNLHPILQSNIYRHNTRHPDAQYDWASILESQNLVDQAVYAIEAESSDFNTEKRDSPLSVILKDEDYPRLANWNNAFDPGVLICQLFFDKAYVLPFSDAAQHIEADRDPERNSPVISGFRHQTIRQYHKKAYRFLTGLYPACYEIGEFVEEPQITKDTPNGPQACDSWWDNTGKLQTDCENAFFYGGLLDPFAVDRILDVTDQD